LLVGEVECHCMSLWGTKSSDIVAT
jgi:hypothetical protein